MESSTLRSTIPVDCRSPSCWASARCVIPVIPRLSSENRFVLWKSCSRTAAFQRPPTIRAVVSTGQSSGGLAIVNLVRNCNHVRYKGFVFPCNHALSFLIYLDHEDIDAGFAGGTQAPSTNRRNWIGKHRKRLGRDACNWKPRTNGRVGTTAPLRRG